MASSRDHVVHVETQLPWALLGAGLALIIGYLPGVFGGISPWLLLAIGFCAVVLWSRSVAKPVKRLQQAAGEKFGFDHGAGVVPRL